MFIVKKSESTAARREVTFTSVDSGSGFPQTRLSGALTFTVKIVKAGGTVITGGGTVTQYDSTNLPGVRTYQAAAGDFDTVGTGGVIRVSATGMEPREIPFMVVEADFFDVVRHGMTALPNAAAEAAGGLYTRGTGAGQINQPANGMVDGNVVRWLNSVPNALQTGRVDAYVGAMAANVVTAASTAADFVTEMTDAIFNYVVENSQSFLLYARGWTAALMGKSSGHDTGNVKYRDQADTKDRITATVNAANNRTAVSTNLT